MSTIKHCSILKLDEKINQVVKEFWRDKRRGGEGVVVTCKLPISFT